MLIKELIPRVLRDIDDGVFVLDLRGHIAYMNPQTEQMLGLNGESLGRSYAQTFLLEHPQKKENDAFHQFVLDAVYDKQQTHSGTVPFFDTAGNKRFLKVTSSFLKGEGSERVGVVLVVSDVTQTEVLRQKRNDACVMFACVVACVSLYLLLISGLNYFGIHASTEVLTQVINVMVSLFAIIIYRKTDFSREELGLKLIRPCLTLVSAVVISAGILAALIAVKLVLLQVSPGFFKADAPFWKWDFGAYFWISYIATCIVQEFLARGMIYGSIRKMFDGKNGSFLAIGLSALLFGAVHIGHSFVLMIGAIVLLGALGPLYDKHGNIWGVAIIHYVLGQAVYCLGFV